MRYFAILVFSLLLIQPSLANTIGLKEGRSLTHHHFHQALHHDDGSAHVDAESQITQSGTEHHDDGHPDQCHLTVVGLVTAAINLPAAHRSPPGVVVHQDPPGITTPPALPPPTL